MERCGLRAPRQAPRPPRAPDTARAPSGLRTPRARHARPVDPRRVRPGRARDARSGRGRSPVPRVSDRALDRPAGDPATACPGLRSRFGLGSFLRFRGGGHMRRLVLSLALPVVAIAFFAASAFGRQAATFKWCTDPTFPPMEYTTTSGKIVGFDVDMATALAKTWGGTSSPSKTAFPGLIPALNAK